MDFVMRRKMPQVAECATDNNIIIFWMIKFSTTDNGQKIGYASYKTKSSKKLVSLWRVIVKTRYASETCSTCYNNWNQHKAENFKLFRATFNKSCFWVIHNGNIFFISCLRLKIAEFCHRNWIYHSKSDLTCSGDLFKNRVFQSLTIGKAFSCLNIIY